MNKRAYEVNFDGIVGPTHNYSGLSWGNIASIANENVVSNPREAALQGLKKMLFLAKLGIPQAVLPPHERPYVPFLRSLGFSGASDAILRSAKSCCPMLLFACSSAAAMWAANAATVSPSADCRDGRVHITPANLSHKFHRSIEPTTTKRILQAIFPEPTYFCIHDPLPPGSHFSDEGAANHMRFCTAHNHRGVEVFVYGRKAFAPNTSQPEKFPARQTLEASQAIARTHQLHEHDVIYAQQNPAAIDAGVFHNDVICTNNQSFLFYHEQAFVNTQEVIDAIQNRLSVPLCLVKVKSSDIPLEDVVSSYLFNSQIVTINGGEMVMLAPEECRQVPRVKHFLDKIDWAIDRVHYCDLRESMRNGGGPACLRLRVVLTPIEIEATNPHVFLSEKLYETLKDWIQRHYRDRLTGEELSDHLLLRESMEALDELTQILHLGSIYPFQMNAQ